MVQRHIARLALLIDQHAVSLRERAALAVLTGEANRITLVEQAREGQSLARRPVDALARVDRVFARVEEALDRLVEMKAVGHGTEADPEFTQLGNGDASLAAARSST